MNKQEIIEQLNQFVDQIVEEHKFELFSRYVRSKKVQFTKTVISFDEGYTYIYGKTATGNDVKIFDRMCDRHPQRIECSCKDYDKRMKFKAKNGKPCKHIFALIERYQSKRTEIINNLKGE
tara:strand:+ start:1408 stop:1770 length:363 start_codon:yes stop_codon:yes gene_type:complete